MNVLKFASIDLAAANAAKVAELFPGTVAEGRINFDLLRAMLGDDVEGDEAYEFTWVGKRAAIAEAWRPVRKTLRPCPEESKNWDETKNLYIEGDNLDVLKLLQESYLGRVKMIYIDPPYNTGNDFIYRDNFARGRDEYDAEAGVYGEGGERLFRNAGSSGRFHSDWCSMMYPRLALARNILRDDGIIFISIDDNEAAQTRKMCDEIFGQENHVGTLPRLTSAQRPAQERFFSVAHDYILAYARFKDRSNFNRIVERDNLDRVRTDRNGRYIEGDTSPILASSTQGYAAGGDYDFAYNGKTYAPVDSNGRRRRWLWVRSRMEAAARLGILVETRSTLRVQNYIDKEFAVGTNIMVDKSPRLILSSRDFMSPAYANAHGTGELAALGMDALFDFAKPVSLIRDLLRLATDGDSLVLDFFPGSSTTAHAVMQLNAEDGGRRACIMVQLPESCPAGSGAARASYANICEIGKERIRRAGERIKAGAGLAAQGLDIGFRVLKLDDSNMKDVYYAAGDYTQDLLSKLESNIKDDRTDLDLLYGCLLDWGLPLSSPHTREVVAGATVHTYNGGDLIACFAGRIPEATVREIARRRPFRAVFRDSGFADSPGKMNVEEIFKLLAPNTVVKVI